MYGLISQVSVNDQAQRLQVTCLRSHRSKAGTQPGFLCVDPVHLSLLWKESGPEGHVFKRHAL